MNSRKNGFTLIEVIAAVAILGIGVLAAVQLFATALRAARASEADTRMTLLAEEKISDMLRNSSLKEGIIQGTEDGFEWKMEVAAFDPKAGGGKNRIFKIAVTVKAKGLRNAFTLTTLKTVTE